MDEDEDYSDYDDDDYYEDEYEINFANPGGRSALRAESEDNPRNCSCPTCGAKNVLTQADRNLSYQCNSCADRDELGY